MLKSVLGSTLLLSCMLTSGAMAAGKTSTAAPAATTVTQLTLIKEVKAGVKGNVAPTGGTGTVYRLEPSAATYSGPIRVCSSYTATDKKDAVGLELRTAVTTLLPEIKAGDGKASYTLPAGDPEDDKAASKLCITLTSK
jgi:hypothetical protein